ncbi:MAG: iron-sulfur cluster assembly scaffold protein [Gemmatimonadetes bacterium]|uniref:Iron-sulfur cluster assembly scaffold protein n=1 Tax=Candidatus Kutchimonas denitrificans TaxID=3056748 RepID=A0AAE4Z6Z3_9BACT|nr:iron-sulfur cluster assembly scaffold protein [Gemmatimonadota bacterium]NIR73612.1 iron-sulfur cluster assembly scaffold protein [Candidatus Kutchimonas denitrificans]NIR99571.1 iron-sulfur cluster assembly scaffold protein [Gemmatimonadota bacterium]NIT65191.1 iron-sulfur cluster assembly scaffold protein [Gemmatimonadota bacterium]NIV23724.1 iron-sulfur cluster assembly scaffold protein [Gemmatimonadota bacterium]
MDRETAILRLVDHYKNPRCSGAIEDADVNMPGGNPGCGDVVNIYVKSDGERIERASFVGTGCTISQAAASILLDRVNREELSFQDVLDYEYDDMIDELGRDVVGFRHRCATLALGTLKAAVKTIEMDGKLRTAGHSEEDIRRLRQQLAARAAGAGLVVGEDAESTSRAGER